MQNDGQEPVGVAADSICVFMYTVLGFQTAPALLPGCYQTPAVTVLALTGSTLCVLVSTVCRRIPRWSHPPPPQKKYGTEAPASARAAAPRGRNTAKICSDNNSDLTSADRVVQVSGRTVLIRGERVRRSL